MKWSQSASPLPPPHATVPGAVRKPAGDGGARIVPPPAPLSLPPLLQPWSTQLSLFPLELALALGDLLLRLQRVVGPLVRRGFDAAAQPAGAGDIARRGSYDRLLLSEWAVADAVPDEFLRRAANGELLFTGPEPERSDAVLRSVVLFDAGPSQLGAPRLAHLALFVLLARRAELAGAAFQWGILQQPGELHADQGRAAVQRLLDARSWAAPGDADAARWNDALGATVNDCWLVGAPVTPRPARVQAVAAVTPAWQGDALDVALVRRGGTVNVPLALPEPRLGARLLRRPFEDAGAVASPVVRSDAISLKRPPLFGPVRDRVGVCQVNGGATLFHVPDTPRAKPGRPRKHGRIPYLDETVAAAVFQKALGTVAVVRGAVRFTGFPGPFFCNWVQQAPARDQFLAVAGAARWTAAFHLVLRKDDKVFERVLMVDKARRLVRWSAEGAAGGQRAARSDFKVVAEGTIGAIQQGSRVLFAVHKGGSTNVYRLIADGGPPVHLTTIPGGGDLLLFGETRGWPATPLYALREPHDTWVFGVGGTTTRLQVDSGATVLGCARIGPGHPPGLVLLESSDTRIVLLTDKGRTILVKSSETIAQASFDPEFQRIAWLTAAGGVLTVQQLGSNLPLLSTLPRGGDT